MQWPDSPARKYNDWVSEQAMAPADKEQAEEHKEWLKIPKEKRLRLKKELAAARGEEEKAREEKKAAAQDPEAPE